MSKQSVQSSKRFQIVLYCTIVLIAISLLMPIGQMHDVVKAVFREDHDILIEGQVDVSQYDFTTEAPLELKGEWYAYEGVYLEEYAEDRMVNNTMVNDTIERLPTASLVESQGTYTYEAFVAFTLPEEDPEELVLAIPFVDDSVAVYLNGVRLEGVGAFSDVAGNSGSIAVYEVSHAYDMARDFQNIVISVNENPEDTQLYKRAVSLSTEKRIVTEQTAVYLMEGILMGTMIMIVIVAIVFMALMPSYSALTFMNLFDITLMSHVLFSTSILPRVFWSIFIPTGYGDVYFKRMDMFLLMVAGAIGNELAMIIWDPYKIAPRIFRKPTELIYWATAFFVVFFPFQVNTAVMLWILLLLAWTFLGIFVTFTMNYKRGNVDLYRGLHFVKTIYLGIIIVTDVATTNSQDRPVNQIVIGYSIFLLIHLLIRAYEYKLPYIETRQLNESLEKIVEERTSELVKANEVLRNMNERDALTNAYNRLYFEEEIMQALDEYSKGDGRVQSMYLCIFDLDNFKSINDTYGHLVGDDQLIEAVQVTREIVGEEARVSRIGGEEFTLLFLNETEDHVLSIVEQVRSSLEERAKQEGRTTGSFGICKATRALNRKAIFSMADECLYEAKATGKNKIVYNFNGVQEVYE